MMRSIAVGFGLAAAHTAHAECVIDRFGPTGTLPTSEVQQEFTFIATDDCTALMFVAGGGALSKRPTRGGVAAVDAHSYGVVLSPTEWRSLLGEDVTVLYWSITATDPASTDRIRVTVTNELDSDRDGWTRSDGDGGACDRHPDVNPGVDEICGNGVDDDCDGTIDCRLNLYEPDAIVEGTVGQGWLGAALATSDVNGDGIADLVSGAPSFRDHTGHVYVSYGPLSGTVSAGDDVTISAGTQVGLGEAVAGGDADGDGYGDVLVVSWNRPDPSPASLLLGPITGDVTTASADLALSSGDSLRRFGYHMEITPDVDGDDRNDIMITAPYAAAWDGAVHVVSGAETGSHDVSGVDTYEFVGSGFLGISAIAVDDVDGDGIDDMAMTDSATTYVVLGGTAPGSYDVSAIASTTITSTGEWWNNQIDTDYLASLDYDQDGHGDLLVGDPDDGFDDDEGAVSLFLGPAAGSLDQSTDASVQWRGNRVGTLVATGDCNGDGTADYLLGGTSAAYLDLGPATGVVEVDTLPTFPQPSASPWGALSFAPDWSGDGAEEIVLGATGTRTAAGNGAGAAYVYYSDRF